MCRDLGEDSRMQGCALNGIPPGARTVLPLRVRRPRVSGDRNEAGIRISQDGRCWIRFMMWATFRRCLCAGMIRQWSYFFNIFITVMEQAWVVMLFYDILYLQQESMCRPGQRPGIQGRFCLLSRNMLRQFSIFLVTHYEKRSPPSLHVLVLSARIEKAIGIAYLCCVFLPQQCPILILFLNILYFGFINLPKG